MNKISFGYSCCKKPLAPETPLISTAITKIPRANLHLEQEISLMLGNFFQNQQELYRVGRVDFPS